MKRKPRLGEGSGQDEEEKKEKEKERKGKRKAKGKEKKKKEEKKRKRKGGEGRLVRIVVFVHCCWYKSFCDYVVCNATKGNLEGRI